MEAEEEIKEVRVSIPVTQYNALLMISEHFNEQIERIHKHYEDTINNLNTDRERLLRNYREIKDEANKTWDENRELTQKVYMLSESKKYVDELIDLVESNPAIFDRSPLYHPLKAVVDLIHEQWSGLKVTKK